MKTALWAAALRADETKQSHPIVNDPYAVKVLGEEGLASGLELESEHPARTYLLARTRLIDELILWVLSRYSIKTVVYPGTGLDTRPYRLDIQSDITWYELDFQRVLDWKAEQLKNDQPRCKVIRVAADLQQPGAMEKSVGAMCASENCLFIVENLLHYLEGIQTQQLFEDIRNLCKGTILITDIGNSALPESKMGRAMFAHMEKSSQLRTKIDDLSGFVKHLGFEIVKSIPLAGLKGDPKTWIDGKPSWLTSKKDLDLLRIVVLEKK